MKNAIRLIHAIRAGNSELKAQQFIRHRATDEECRLCKVPHERETPYHVIEECIQTQDIRERLKKVIRQNGVLYPRLIDIVLDRDHIKPSLKDHKKPETKKIDKERKTFIEEIFRLLVM